MKKVLILTVMLAFASLWSTNAQFEKGNSALNLGIGVGNYFSYGSDFKTTLLPLEGSYEIFLSSNFSIGGFLGTYASKWEHSNSLLKITTEYSYIFGGVLGNYHFVNNNKFDVYVGGRLGYLNQKISTDNKSSSSLVKETNSDAKGSGILFTAQLGARYFLSNSIAINAELGYGIAPLKIGATLKF